MATNKIKGLTIEIGGENTQLVKSMAEINRHSKDLKSELKDVERLLKLDPKNTEMVTQKQKLLADQITNTKDRLTDLKEAEKQVQEQVKRGEASEEQYRALQREIIKTEEELKKAEKAAKEFGGVMTQSLKEAGEKMKDVGGKISDVGKDMTMKVTAPILGLAGAALKVGSDFEAGMSEVQAISGASAEDLQRLEEKAKEMGATTKFSATESAEALKYMAMAGWDAEKMVGGLEGVMNLAAASGENLGTVSDIVTDAITAFGLKAEDAAHFADVLATASSSSNTNVSLMGETFKYAAPIAGALGFSIEDTALAIGLMANAGIKGSQSGTALRQILTVMAGDIAIVGDKFGQFDIVTQNADGSMRSLSEIMVELREIWPMLTDAEKAHNAEMIVGKNAMSGFLALMGASDEDFTKLQTNIEDSSGKAKEMADIMNDNLQGQLTLLKSQLEGVGIQISEILIPIVSSIIDKISEWIDWFANLDEGTKKTIVVIALIVAAIGPLLFIVGQVIMTIGALILLLPQLKIAFAALTGPIGLTVAAIAGAIAIGIALYNNWDEIKAAAQKLWENLKQKFNEIKEAITKPVKDAIQTIKDINLVEVGENMIQGLINGIKNMISKVKEAIGSVVSTVTSGIKKALKIESPSKVMEEMGEYTAEGFAVGIKGSLKEVERQTSAMARIPVEASTPTATASNSVVTHTGVLRVEGVNNKGDLTAVVDIVMDQLRREVRA